MAARGSAGYLPESGSAGAAVPPEMSLLPLAVPEVGWASLCSTGGGGDSSLGAGVVAVGVSVGVVSVGGGGVGVVAVVVASTGVAGAVGVWVEGSWVDSVVTSVTGWATGLGGSGTGVGVVATEVVSGKLAGSLGGPAGLGFLARRRLWTVARPAPAATEADTLTGWDTEWVTTGALLGAVEATEVTLAG